ncbi:MAG: isoprenylcysteine carboxylmethyltransferase family protein [Proteobacteria bacterium]|nr:isoprenylcysteine carboxylmethyltransferase family protein [Desulfobulbaceae bacterium]MBU4152669.1 isoprenylcysteine carboxylmethyltransferase family protein [Pseudomonadota bacterium]MDP2106805.1 isoprenylcysteine carboxylmethyltransferase family protein [Desulfobulbaceae bacterium]
MSTHTPKHSPLIRHRLQAALVYWIGLPGTVIGSGLLIDMLLTVPRIKLTPYTLGCGGLFLCTGLALISWSNRDLLRLGLGTPSPASPCRRLVTTGSYKLCRHPMFLGYDLASFAVLLFVGSPAALLVSYPIMLAWQTHFLKREEHILLLRFTKEYQDYQAIVPFLIPFPAPRPR